MPSGYNQMGGVPDFYSSLLSAAQRNLVRMPDGTYAQSPTFGQGGTQDVYAGIFPQASNTTAQRPSTVYVRPDGSERWPAVAGQTAMPPGARPSSIPSIPSPPLTSRSVRTVPIGLDGNPTTALAAINSAVPGPDLGYTKDESRMAPGDALAFNGAGATDNGWNPSLLASLFSKTAPAPIAPSPIMPRAAGAASAPSGAYTIKSGDTLSSLAKRFGTTVAQLANANGISNPNKIKAGASLNLAYLAPPVPQQRPASLQSSDQRGQSALRAAGVLDNFGMIR